MLNSTTRKCKSKDEEEKEEEEEDKKTRILGRTKFLQLFL